MGLPADKQTGAVDQACRMTPASSLHRPRADHRDARHRSMGKCQVAATDSGRALILDHHNRRPGLNYRA